MITQLPPREAEAERWQLVMRFLVNAADHGGIVTLARIAVLRAQPR
jgi:hypothetical protein